MLNTIFLIGYMGAGKSVIGKSLSKNNGFNFYDLDKYIEEKEGKKISEIFSDNNEIYFRKIENNYLKEISQIKENKIISTGGGTPCFQNNFEIIDDLPNSISVYLKATADTLTDRLKDSIEKRPLISHLQNPVELKEFWSLPWKASVVYCSQSINPPKIHQERAANTLGAKWHEIQTGHYPMLSEPDALAQIITDEG